MKKLTVFLPVLAVLLTNCNKDESTPADKLTLEQFLSTNEKPSKFFTVSNAAASAVNGDKLHLNFFPGSFTYSNGDSVTGDVQIEIKELFTKTDFLFAKKPTITDKGEILQSDGAFKIAATQNGQELKLKRSPIASFSHYGTLDLSKYDQEMELFKGSTDSIGQPVWVNIQDSVTWLNVMVQAPFYGIKIKDFGWYNCDKVISNSGPTATLTVTITNQQPSVTNTVAAIIFWDLNSCVAMTLNDSVYESTVPVNATVTIAVVHMDETFSGIATTNTMTISGDYNQTLTLVQKPESEIARELEQLNE